MGKSGRLLWLLGGLSAGGAAACGTEPAPGARLEFARTTRDLLADPPAWRVLEAHAGEPSIGVISPSRRPSVDGGDLPALIVPPDAALAFRLEAGDLPATLRARAGVDLGALAPLKQAHLEGVLEFEILGDGQRLALARLPLNTTRPGDNAWVELGGAAGIELTVPLELTLRTAAVTTDGRRLAAPEPIAAGFGALRLERRVSRPRAPSAPGSPNVVLVVMDTLRADRLSAYDYERPTSPALEALAARGILHEEAYSTSSWTWPATASLLTGLTPREHGMVGSRSSFLPSGALTLAELFQDQGLTTAAWSGNPIVGPLRHFDQGFEHFHGPTEAFRTTGEFFEEVRVWLREHAHQRFFLYLHLADPHAPLRPRADSRRALAARVPPGADADIGSSRHALSRGQAWPAGAERPEVEALVAPELQAWASDLYDASVHSGDHWLGELVATLRGLDLEERTVLAFTSDHGEELFERGFFGHGQGLQREQVRVPLVLAGPGVPVGVRSRRVLSTRMLAPGLAALAGLAFPGLDCDGAEILGLGPDPGEALFSTSKGFWKGVRVPGLLGIRRGPWTLQLCTDDLTTPPGARQALYSASDPGESHDLARSRPDELEALRARLRERSEALGQRRVGASVEAGAATRTLLDQLGYGGGE